MDASSDLNDSTVPLSKTKHPDCKIKKDRKTTVPKQPIFLNERNIFEL